MQTSVSSESSHADGSLAVLVDIDMGFTQPPALAKEGTIPVFLADSSTNATPGFSECTIYALPATSPIEYSSSNLYPADSIVADSLPASDALPAFEVNVPPVVDALPAADVLPASDVPPAVDVRPAVNAAHFVALPLEVQPDPLDSEPADEADPFAEPSTSPDMLLDKLDKTQGELEPSSEGVGPEVPDYIFDLPPSSPPPSSSSPPMFSSPGRSYDSPPSSSPPLLQNPNSFAYNAEETSHREAQTQPEAQTDDALSSHGSVMALDDREAIEEERPAKRMKVGLPPSAPEAPLPKRFTLAAVAKQHKKLAAPFRSPVVKGPLVEGGLHAVYTTGRPLAPAPRKIRVDAAGHVTSLKPDPAIANKDRTANVAKQFKSPLAASSPPSAAFTTSAVKATPTIQALQGKVQMLKQAIRIKNSRDVDDDDELGRLVDKWTNAGREVAWAVWEYVKDLDPGSAGMAGQAKSPWFENDNEKWGTHAGHKRSSDPGWALEDEHLTKRPKLEGDVQEDDMQEEDSSATVQHSLGTMLRHMGIDPATLGWDEEEGDFVDA
ncbi:hypothetical protein FKP32DRAFT_1588462 [Trametes sanguinea]|nr:hypothetical protein FKP32DRAFT_1588462 [Trametes sanguinea]